MILVTGATGNVGQQVISQLDDRGFSVRALTRDPQGAGFPENVDVVAGDLSHPGTLEPLMDGVDAVFLVWPFSTPEAAHQLGPAVIDTLAARARRIVYLSAAAAAQQPDAFWSVIERLVEASGVEWTFLRPSGFAANTRMWADQIRGGDVVRWPYGDAARALIHERDIAAIAVRALTQDDLIATRPVLTGPSTVSQIEQVRAIGDAIGRSIRWEELPRDQALEQLSAAWGDAAFADHALDTWAGFVSTPEPVTDTIEQITGAPARSFREWARDHAGDFATVQQGTR
jgi:uncharacterized protein YbjT (DUF2867 family)